MSAVVPLRAMRKTIFDPLPDSQVITVRPSTIVAFENCSFATAFSLAGIVSQARSSALIFGTIVHEIIDLHVTGLARADELPPLFQERWEAAKKQAVIRYSSQESFESLLATGRRQMELFPEWYKRSGFRPLRLSDGSFATEQRMLVQVAPGVVLSVQPDFIGYATLAQVDPYGFVMVKPGDVVILDWKTPKSASSIAFAQRSVQPTCYKIVAEAHRDMLGLNAANVAAVGYVELLKKKWPARSSSGPEITHPFLYPRSDVLVDEAIRKTIKTADRIRRGEFFRESKMAFNTPCDLCEFAEACLTGNDDGLVLPTGITKAMLFHQP